MQPVAIQAVAGEFLMWWLLSESGKLHIQSHMHKGREKSEVLFLKVLDSLDLYIIHCTESAEDI